MEYANPLSALELLRLGASPPWSFSSKGATSALELLLQGSDLRLGATSALERPPPWSDLRLGATSALERPPPLGFPSLAPPDEHPRINDSIQTWKDVEVSNEVLWTPKLCHGILKGI